MAGLLPDMSIDVEASASTSCTHLRPKRKFIGPNISREPGSNLRNRLRNEDEHRYETQSNDPHKHRKG